MILTKAEIEELVKKCEGHLEGPWFNGVIDRKTVQDLCWNGAFGVDVLIIADKPPLPESEATKIQLQAVAIMPVNNGNIEAIDIANCELLAASPALLSTCKDQAEKIEWLQSDKDALAVFAEFAINIAADAWVDLTSDNDKQACVNKLDKIQQKGQSVLSELGIERK